MLARSSYACKELAAFGSGVSRRGGGVSKVLHEAPANGRVTAYTPL